MDVDGASRHGEVIKVVTRAAAILQLFRPGRPWIKAADVVAEVGLQRSTVERYLASLAAEGFIRADENARCYPGPLLVRLGAVWSGSLNILDVAQAHLKALSARTHETAVLSLWAGHGTVVVRAEMDPNRVTQVSVRVGSLLPLAAAQSQLFLAYIKDRRPVADLLRDVAPGERADLLSSIERAGREGYAVATDVEPGIRTIAAPVIDPRNQEICATVALVGTTASLSAVGDAPGIEALLGTAGAITRDLNTQL